MKRFAKRLSALEARKRALEAPRKIVEIPQEIDSDAEIARQLRTSPDFGITVIWDWMESLSAAGDQACLKPETWARVTRKRTQQ